MPAAPVLRRHARRSPLAGLVVPAFAWSAKFTDYRIGLAVVVVGAAFLGAILPLVSHFGIPADDRAGSRLSYVYLANILGSAAGSLFTGFVLMDRMSLLGIARLLVVSGFALSAALIAMSGLMRASAIKAYATLGLAVLGAFCLSPLVYDRLYERLIYKNEYDGRQRFVQIVENKSESPRGREVHDDLLGFNDIAPRSAILEYHTKLATDVTDDNMVIEWRDPLRYPELVAP